MLGRPVIPVHPRLCPPNSAALSTLRHRRHHQHSPPPHTQTHTNTCGESCSAPAPHCVCTSVSVCVSRHEYRHRHGRRGDRSVTCAFSCSPASPQVKLPRSNPNGLAILGWALCRLGARPRPRWREAWTAAAGAALPGLGANQGFTNIIWALACWQHVPPAGWLEEFCR